MQRVDYSSASVQLTLKRLTIVGDVVARRIRRGGRWRQHGPIRLLYHLEGHGV